MHRILVHAQHFCACTGGARDQGWDPNKKQPPRAGPAAVFFWVPALVPGLSSACTRVLCMHKSVVHSQESRACTRILTNKTYQDVPRRTKTYQEVPRRTKTYQDVPRNMPPPPPHPPKPSSILNQANHPRRPGPGPGCWRSPGPGCWRSLRVIGLRLD